MQYTELTQQLRQFLVYIFLAVHTNLGGRQLRPGASRSTGRTRSTGSGCTEPTYKNKSIVMGIFLADASVLCTALGDNYTFPRLDCGSTDFVDFSPINKSTDFAYHNI